MIIKMFIILTLSVALLNTVNAIDPPSLDPAFQVAFDETFIEPCCLTFFKSIGTLYLAH